MPSKEENELLAIVRTYGRRRKAPPKLFTLKVAIHKEMDEIAKTYHFGKASLYVLIARILRIKNADDTHVAKLSLGQCEYLLKRLRYRDFVSADVIRATKMVSNWPKAITRSTFSLPKRSAIIRLYWACRCLIGI